MPLDLNLRTMIGARALTHLPRAGLAILVLVALVVTPMLPFRAPPPAAPSGAPTSPSAPLAMSVHEVVPAEVEPGDRVALLGEGFPADRRARVVFRGTLFRPGERATREVEIELPAVRLAPERVEVVLDDEAERLFCGAGERATHTTFSGDVEVAFAPIAAGEPPIAASLAGVELDVRPGAHLPAAQREAEREGEGERFLGWLGVRAIARPAGLVVVDAVAASRAASAGIVAGDAIETFDGVRVSSPADVLPALGEREARVVVRRAADGIRSGLSLGVAGFRRAPAVTLLPAVVLVAGVLLFVLLFAAPLPRPVGAALVRVLARARLRSRAEAERERSDARWGEAVALGLVAAWALAAPVLEAAVDPLLLLVACAGGLAAAAFMGADAQGEGPRRAVRVAGAHLPAASAVACAVMAAGSLRLGDIQRAQGVWPWEWLAFREPLGLASLALLLSCLLVDPAAGVVGEPAFTRRAKALALAELVEPPPGGGEGAHARPVWLDAVCRVHAVLVAALASALYLGGSELAGLPTASRSAYPLLALGGAAAMLVKTWALVRAAEWARRMHFPRPDRSPHRVIALALGMLGATFLLGWGVDPRWSSDPGRDGQGWGAWGPSPAVALLGSVIRVVFVVLGALAVAHRLRRGVPASAGPRSPAGPAPAPGAADVRMSPFL